MGGFDKIKSGLEGLDTVLQHIRMGDNVVWQVSNIKDYKYVAEAFKEQGLLDKRKIIYIRFAEHEGILKKQEGIKIIRLNSEAGFEDFTVKVNEIITREGKEAF